MHRLLQAFLLVSVILPSWVSAEFGGDDFEAPTCPGAGNCFSSTYEACLTSAPFCRAHDSEQCFVKCTDQPECPEGKEFVDGFCQAVCTNGYPHPDDGTNCGADQQCTPPLTGIFPDCTNACPPGVYQFVNDNTGQTQCGGDPYAEGGAFENIDTQNGDDKCLVTFGATSGDAPAQGSVICGVPGSSPTYQPPTDTVDPGDSITVTNENGEETTITETVTENPDGTITTTTTSNGPNGSSTTSVTTDSEGNVISVTGNGQGLDESPYDEEENEFASGGVSCLSEPVCSGDVIDCAHLRQTWLLRCDRLADVESYLQSSDSQFENQLAQIGDEPAINEDGTLALPTTEISIDAIIASENVFNAQSGFGPGSCPQPSQLDLGFTSVTISFDFICSVLDLLRPLVLLIFGFISARIIFASFAGL